MNSFIFVAYSIIACTNLKTEHHSEKQFALIDSLMKYSYSLIGQMPNDRRTIAQGTCFFVRTKNATFLVTAAHVLNGWNNIHHYKDIPYPDTLYLRLFRKDNNNIEFLPISIVQMKAKIDSSYYYEKPDVCFFEIKIPDIYRIYSLEKIILDGIKLTDNPDEVITYGFPNNSDNDFNHYIIQPPKVLTGNIFGNIVDNVIWHSDNKILSPTSQSDPLNYIVEHRNENLNPGRSGSPVFLKFNQKIIFGGLCFGGDDTQKQLYVIRPEIIKTILSAKVDGEN